MGLSSYVGRYFWDIDTKAASPTKHPRYYATRILEKGDVKAVRWLFRVIGKNRVKELLPTLKLSARSANFWRHYFNLT